MNTADLPTAALDRGLLKLRHARPHGVGVYLDGEAAAALVDLVDSTARDIAALARVLGMLEDSADEERELFRRTRDRLHVRPGQHRAPVEWRRGRVGMAAELYGAANALVRKAQREEVVATT